MIGLTRRDATMLIDLFDNPPKPNAALKRALKRYKGKIENGKDEKAASFYKHFGFIPLPDDPLTLVIPLSVIADDFE